MDGLMAHRAVIFDWGGVLMRTEDHSPRLAWDARLGLAPGSVERVVHGIPEWRQAQRGKISSAAYWRAVQRHLGLAPEEALALRNDFYSGDRLDEQLVGMIRELRECGMRTGLLSNNTPDLRDEMRALKLNGIFDAVVISAEIGVMKPEPAAYHAILDAVGAAPQEAILIDDFTENVAGARAIGMQAVHFTPTLDLRGALAAWQGWASSS